VPSPDVLRKTMLCSGSTLYQSQKGRKPWAQREATARRGPGGSPPISLGSLFKVPLFAIPNVPHSCTSLPEVSYSEVLEDRPPLLFFRDSHCPVFPFIGTRDLWAFSK